MIVSRSRGTRRSSTRGAIGSSDLTCSISRSRSRRVEGRLEGQQLVKGQAQGVNVGPDVGFPAKTLGGHVANRAQNVAGLCQAVVVGLGQSEVGDPDDAVGVEKEVRRLDVAVHHAPGVGVSQPERRLEPDPGDAPGVLGSAGFDRRDLRPARQHGRGE